MDGGAWWAAVRGVANSRTQLSDCTFTFHFHALEKEMATHSSVLAWRIPGTAEPDGLLSIGLTESDTTEATWQQQQQVLSLNSVLLSKDYPNILVTYNNNISFSLILHVSHRSIAAITKPAPKWPFLVL